MLFHVTHTHGYETCMAHDENRKTKFSQTVANANQSDMKEFLINYPIAIMVK